MDNNVEQFNASAQDLEQRASAPHKSITAFDKLGNASDGKTRGMHGKKLVSLAVILLAGVGFLFLSIDKGRAQDQSAAQIQAKKQKNKSSSLCFIVTCLWRCRRHYLVLMVSFISPQCSISGFCVPWYGLITSTVLLIHTASLPSPKAIGQL